MSCKLTNPLSREELTLDAPLRAPLDEVLVSKPNDENILMRIGQLSRRYTVLIAGSTRAQQHGG